MHSYLNVFTWVRSQTDGRQTEIIITFQTCWKVLKIYFWMHYFANSVKINHFFTNSFNFHQDRCTVMANTMTRLENWFFYASAKYILLHLLSILFVCVCVCAFVKEFRLIENKQKCPFLYRDLYISHDKT